jgi:hypothetical protein
MLMFLGMSLKMIDSAITKKQSNTGNIYIEETGNLKRKADYPTNSFKEPNNNLRQPGRLFSRKPPRETSGPSAKAFD